METTIAPPKSRDHRVAEAIEYVLADRSPTGRWLVVDDRTGRIAAALPDAHEWHRLALAGVSATVAPPRGPFDGAIVRLPKGRETFRLVLHQVVAVCRPDAPIIVAGANDEGIRPVEQRVRELTTEAETITTRRHCRVIQATGRTGEVRGDLEAWARPVEQTVAGVDLSLVTYPGLFAHGRLDQGTAFLLGALPELEGRVLDFACGPGAIAQFIVRRGDSVTLTMSDVDPLALHAAAKAVPEAIRILADGLPEGGPYRAIVSNPPLHLGKDEQRSVLRALAETAPARLHRKGMLVVVVPGTVAAGRWLSQGFGKVDRIAHDAHYGVWVAKR